MYELDVLTEKGKNINGNQINGTQSRRVHQVKFSGDLDLINIFRSINQLVNNTNPCNLLVTIDHISINRNAQVVKSCMRKLSQLLNFGFKGKIAVVSNQPEVVAYSYLMRDLCRVGGSEFRIFSLEVNGRLWLGN